LENFVYEQTGSDFIKLIDFGFSKYFQDSPAMHESMGTVNYVAPEVLAKSYTGGSCDMWSLGVIVFVFLAGRMPFYGRSDDEVLRAIQSGHFTMPTASWSHISEPAQDFVKRLLVVEPADRMTAEQAIGHPWMASQSGVGLNVSGQCLASSAASLATSKLAWAAFSFARATRFQQACMRMIAWALPLEERRLLRGVFLELDTSHAGVVRLPQLRKILEEGKQTSELDLVAVMKAFAALDVDQDEELHYSDFLAVMIAPRLELGGCDAIEEAFGRFDVDGLGYLTRGGFWQTFSPEVSELELQHTFRLLDIDKDDKVYLKDFAGYLRGDFAVASYPL